MCCISLTGEILVILPLWLVELGLSWADGVTVVGSRDIDITIAG